MNNLTTRKMVFGLLMALVLAFGVQGTADAVQRPTPAVSVLIPDSNQAINDTLSLTLPTFTADSDSKTDEKVTIKISSGILLTTTGHHGKSTVTLAEDGESGSDLAVTTLAGRFLAAGKQTITVSGHDYNKETSDPIFSGNWSLTYVYYVTQPATNVQTATINLASIRNGYKAAVYRDISIYEGDRNHYHVVYSPIEGLTYKIPGRTDDIPVPNAGISSAFKVNLTGDTDSEVITATVGTSQLTTTGAYFYGQPVLAVREPPTTTSALTPTPPNHGDESDPAKSNALLPGAFTATVAGGDAATGLAGILVKFEVNDKTSAGGNLVFTEGDGTTGILVDSSNKQIWDNNSNTRVTTGSGKILYIRTGDTNAQVDFRLGTAAEQKVTISAVGQTKEVSAFTDVPDTYELSVDEIRDISGKYGLYILAENAGTPIAGGWDVVFTTADGSFEGTGTVGTDRTDRTFDFIAPTDGGRRIVQRTDERGIAYVIFDPRGNSGTLEVTASIKNDANFTAATARTAARLTFDAVRGAPTTRRDDQQVTNIITVSPSSITGEAGTTQTLTVSAGTATVRVADASAFTAAGGTITGTGTTRSVTLPDTPGSTYTIILGASGYTDVTVSVIVTAPVANGTLTPTLGARTGASVPITVRAVRGGSAQSGVNITITGGVTSTSRQTDSSGSASAIITLPTSASAHTLTVSATGYDTAQVTAAAPGQQQTGDTSQPTTTRGSAGVADSIQISGQPFQTGTANTQLDLPLSVRVLDGNDVGVENVRVTFRVRTGQGRLSLPNIPQRGNGQGVQLETDRSGYARAFYTPLGKGTSTVRVNAAGVTQTVTFTITANGASDTGTDPRTEPGTDELDPSQEISPEVLLGADRRPPMLWVDSGGVYALVGASVGRLTPSAATVMDIAVSGNKIYWTQMTGENAGTINAANLDGTGAKQLVSIRAVPRGIAVDPVAERLYWTNSHGWIQSSNFQGTRRQNVAQDLSDPMGIAVGNGSVYWTDGDGGLRAVNLTGTKAVRDISTGTDATDGVAVFGGKVYWTEMTGENAGTINSVNLDGTGAKQLVSIRAVPRGIAVDPVDERLYWTNSHGWIQSSDLEGRARRNVANGLGSPGGIAVSANIKAPAATPTQTESTPTASKSKYDINGDGTVDSTDVDALLLAVLAELTDAKYDVNGDGAVDAKDVREVNKNLGAAGAPALLGMKFSALEVDRLQEQIDLLIATNDHSPAAMRTLVYLQQLIAMARPDQTQLLANYPNPFNPETWIPYELATDTDVRITIYNAQGVVIRTLQLGQQSAGYYTDRERAAYWDGRNAFGEQVASGVYFYQLETDTISALRKMVILK